MPKNLSEDPPLRSSPFVAAEQSGRSGSTPALPRCSGSPLCMKREIFP